MTAHVHGIIKNRIGFITLDRARALNALSLDMIRALTTLLRDWQHNDDVLAVAPGAVLPAAPIDAGAEVARVCADWRSALQAGGGDARRLQAELPAQVLPGERPLRPRQVSRRPLEHHSTAVVAGARS